MDIPMKYEDVVAKLTLERHQAESTLGELEDLVEKLNNALGENDALQQRLTVAELALGGMLFAFDDGVGREWSAPLLDFARTVTTAVEFKAKLKPAAEGEGHA